MLSHGAHALSFLEAFPLPSSLTGAPSSGLSSPTLPCHLGSCPWWDLLSAVSLLGRHTRKPGSLLKGPHDSWSAAPPPFSPAQIGTGVSASPLPSRPPLHPTTPSLQSSLNLREGLPVKGREGIVFHRKQYSPQ